MSPRRPSPDLMKPDRTSPRLHHCHPPPSVAPLASARRHPPRSVCSWVSSVTRWAAHQPHQPLPWLVHLTTHSQGHTRDLAPPERRGTEHPALCSPSPGLPAFLSHHRPPTAILLPHWDPWSTGTLRSASIPLLCLPFSTPR